MESPSQHFHHFHHFHQAKEKQKVDSFVTLAEQRATTAISAADGVADAGSAEDGHGSALSFLELREEPEPESLLNVLAEGVAKVVGKYGKY